MGHEIIDIDEVYVLGKTNEKGEWVPMNLNATQEADSLKINMISLKKKLRAPLSLNMLIYDSDLHCLVPTLIGEPYGQQKDLVNTPRMITSGIVQFDDRLSLLTVATNKKLLEAITHATLNRIASDAIMDFFEDPSNINLKTSLESRMHSILLFAQHPNVGCPHYYPVWRNCGCLQKYYPNQDKLLVHTPEDVVRMNLIDVDTLQ